MFSRLVMKPCLRAAAPCNQIQQVRGISNTVFLKGLPEAVTEEALVQFFKEYGEITSTKMLFLDKKIRSHNALITFANYNSAFSVVDELHHSTLFGRRIVAEFSRFKAPPKYHARRPYVSSPPSHPPSSSSSPSSSTSTSSSASVPAAAAATAVVDTHKLSHVSNDEHNEGSSSSSSSSNELESSSEAKQQSNEEEVKKGSQA